MQERIEGIVEGFVRSSADDYTGLWEVVGAAERLMKQTKANRSTNQAIKALTLDLVRRMLFRGFQAGYLASGKGFDPWPDQNPQSVIGRIETEWEELGDLPNIGDICWFDRPTQV